MADYLIDEQEPNTSESDREFANKIYMCLCLLGGKSDLLGTVAGWRTTLPDLEVFQGLDAWIESYLNEKQNVITYVSESHRKS